MLEAVKYGIAMGNANDNLKQIADFITLDVDNDGVAYALKQYTYYKNKPTINMKKRSIGKRGNYKLLSVHFIKLAGTSVNSSCRISFASIFPSGPTKIM